MNCMRVAKEGGSIAIFPEGNRTFSGETGAMNPAIGGLAKKLGLPIAFFKIEGGYGVQPRWSDVRRKGKMKAYVASVLEPEEYKSWNNEQLYQYICKALYQNEANAEENYYHKNSAEYLERVLYVCPQCGITHFESHGDTVECMSCHRKAKYLPSKEFAGDFPFHFMLDWYNYQQDYINELDTLALTQQPLLRDTCSLYLVALYSKKQCLAKNVELALYGDRIEIWLDADYDLVYPGQIGAAAVINQPEGTERAQETSELWEESAGQAGEEHRITVKFAREYPAGTIFNLRIIYGKLD